ncbi:hypothetical protein UB45_07810 [Terrabacter sp. 28]|nr:hypothetical protein UB45_07810 [Terrabacter sp. 28]
MPAHIAVPQSASPGIVYPGQSFLLFTPPSRRRRMDTRDPLFRRMFINEGMTLVKDADGSYVLVDTPSEEQSASAAVVYTGGHTYQVSLAEADALTAAGYEVHT